MIIKSHPIYWKCINIYTINVDFNSTVFAMQIGLFNRFRWLVTMVINCVDVSCYLIYRLSAWLMNYLPNNHEVSLECKMECLQISLGQTFLLLFFCRNRFGWEFVANVLMTSSTKINLKKIQLNIMSVILKLCSAKHFCFARKY